MLLVFGAILLLTIYVRTSLIKDPAFLVLLISAPLLPVLRAWHLFSEISLTFPFVSLMVVLTASIIVWILVRKYYTAGVRDSEKSALNFIDLCISEITNVGILMTDSTDLIVKSNPFVETMFGYHKGELIRNRTEKLFQASDLKNSDSEKSHYSLGYDRNATHKQIQGRKKDGSVIPVVVAVRSLRIADGDFNVLFIREKRNGTSADQPITNLVAIKGAYYDFAPLIFLALNKRGEVVTINKHGCDVVGCNSEEVVTMNWFNNFIAASDRYQFMKIFYDCLKTHDEKTFGSHVRDRQHRLKLIQWKCGVDLQNDMVLYVGGDITEREAQHVALMRSLSNVNRLKEKLEERVRKRTRDLEIINVDLELQIDERRVIEDRLINSQRLYSAIAHNFPNGLIAVLDMTLNFMMIDGRELTLLGLSADELIGTGVFDGTHPLVDGSSRKHMENVLLGNNTTFEITLRSSVYSVIAVPLYDQQDTIYAILLVMQNITESKRLEESLYKAIETEKKLNDLKSRFVTMASHEFRTPLGTILSSLFLLESYSGALYEEKKHVHINRIKRTVNMLTETLNDFLRLGKLEEGRVEMILSDVNIREHTEDIMRELQSLMKPGQTIHYRHEGLNLTISIDKILLRGILSNLLSNAVKYSPEGAEVFLNVFVSSEQLRIVVVDRGIGIAPEEQEQIFQRFFRALNAINIEGTGLGLHIVKKYVELMHGTIEFASGDRGTTFTVKIPLKFSADNTRLILN